MLYYQLSISTAILARLSNNRTVRSTRRNFTDARDADVKKPDQELVYSELRIALIFRLFGLIIMFCCESLDYDFLVFE
jgi:hypothetical protein